MYVIPETDQNRFNRDTFCWLKSSFALSKSRIGIFSSLETMRFFGNVVIVVFIINFLIVTFDWKRNLKFWWFYRKDLDQTYQSQSYFELRKNSICENQFLNLSEPHAEFSYQNIGIFLNVDRSILEYWIKPNLNCNQTFPNDLVLSSRKRVIKIKVWIDLKWFIF